MEVKANAQLGAHQRGVAESAKGAPEVARKSGDDRLEKRTTLLTNTGLSGFLLITATNVNSLNFRSGHTNAWTVKNRILE